MLHSVLKNQKSSGKSVIFWLLAANVIALTIFGCRYWYLSNKERQEQQKQIQTVASVMANTGEMNITDATKLLNLSNDLEHGAEMPDADLDWCLDQLKGQEPSYNSALSRRQNVDIVLSEAVKVLDPPQKEKLYQALATEMAQDDPKEEVGIDVRSPAHVLGKLGDKRAIPLLEAHLNDERPFVHQSVQRALNRLEGKAVK